MSSTKLAYVVWSGTKIVAGQYGSQMYFEPEEGKWVKLGDFLASFMDESEAIPTGFSIVSIVDPGSWSPNSG